jgi:hypothetical protein
MSDTWYRDPPDLPPFVDGFGCHWTLDGRCLDHQHDDAWPQDWIAKGIGFDEWRLMFEFALVQAYHDAYDSSGFVSPPWATPGASLDDPPSSER